MKIIVTGASGFVGSNLIDKLLILGHEILGIDNLSTGFEEHNKIHKLSSNFKFNKMDLMDLDEKLFKGYDCVIHLAALADIRYNKNNFSECLNKNIIGTNNVLEACVNNNIKKVLFASTCSVYGDAIAFPTPETTVGNQTSVYSATKHASEVLFEGFANTFQFHAYCMRFVSMLGPRYSHGHVFDFTKKILRGDKNLDILGNGESLKSYLHIEDAIDGVIALLNYDSSNWYEIYNIGHDETIKLKYSVNTILEKLKYKGSIKYGETQSGWVGDNPYVIPSTAKLKSLGWEPRWSIKDSIIDTVDYLISNPWIRQRD